MKKNKSKLPVAKTRPQTDEEYNKEKQKELWTELAQSDELVGDLSVLRRK